MARPRKKLTRKEASQVEALAAYLSKEQIADYFGISRVTFNAILERDERVSLHYKKGKAKAIANVAQGLIKNAMAGNTASQIFYLKTQAGWKETTIVDNKSSDGSMSPKQGVDLSGLSDEQLRTLNAIASQSKTDTSGTSET